MRRTTVARTRRTRVRLAWCLVLFLVPCLLASVHFFGNATSALAQEDLSPESISISENFDTVTAPVLPNNWVSTASGSLVPFVTSTVTPDTAPNALFAPNPATVGLAEITSPAVRIGSSGSHVVFRHNYLTENTFDGCVLEIKIGTSEFQDIIQAGGTFVSGPYNGTISSGFQNPLAGRAAWTGTSAGYIKTDVNLPAAALGQTVQFKWRIGTDTVVGATGWRIDTYSVNTDTGENANAIAIPDSGTASLYPSNINVTNQIGEVTNVTVALNNFSHASPDDVDIMLVAPGGRKIVLMSDVGGTTPVNNITLTFQDDATGSLPDNGPLVSGSFKPTNVGDDESFPAPAPAGPMTGNTLSSFNGINANGIWSLYVVDDNGNNSGNISGGWEILIATSLTTCSLNLSSNLQVYPITGGSGSFDVTSPFGCGWTANTIDSFVHLTSPTSGGGGVSTITFDVDPNMTGGRTGIIRLSGNGLIRDFNIQQPSGCPFSLSQTTQQFSAIGGPGSVNVTAAGVCGWSGTTPNSWIVINSGAGSGNGIVSYTVVPNTTISPRTGTVTIGARTLTVNQDAGNGRTTLFDFDGDDKADLSVFRHGLGTWYISNSSNGSVGAQQFGLPNDSIVTADYDGDGRSDLAVFRQGTWYILGSLNGLVRTVQWGVAADWLAPGDYDGDGKADIAVWRESTGTWYIQRSSDGVNHAEHFGSMGDYPVARDYDGDGKTDIAVFRPSAQAWYIQRSSDSTLQSQVFGLLGDKLAPADYDGDGKTDLAVWRVQSSTWYLLQSSAGFAAVQFGTNLDQIVPADYDGDGKADIAVMRQGIWYILQSSNGAVRTEQWGTSADVAVPFALIAT